MESTTKRKNIEKCFIELRFFISFFWSGSHSHSNENGPFLQTKNGGQRVEKARVSVSEIQLLSLNFPPLTLTSPRLCPHAFIRIKACPIKIILMGPLYTLLDTKRRLYFFVALVSRRVDSGAETRKRHFYNLFCVFYSLPH